MPSGSVVADCTTLPDESLSSTVTPGAQLALLDDAGLAAAGLEVAPDDTLDRTGLAGGFDRLPRPLRHVRRGDPGQAEQGDAAGMERRLQEQASPCC